MVLSWKPSNKTVQGIRRELDELLTYQEVRVRSCTEEVRRLLRGEG